MLHTNIENFMNTLPERLQIEVLKKALELMEENKNVNTQTDAICQALYADMYQVDKNGKMGYYLPEVDAVKARYNWPTE